MRNLFFLLIILPLFSFSQRNWTKVEATVFMSFIRNYEQLIPEKEHYSIEMEYKIFNDFEDEQYSQSFEGKLICREGKYLNAYQMGNLMVQGLDFNINIDTASRQLLVQKSDSSFYHRKTVSDYVGLSEITETIYQKEQNGNTIFMLEFKKGYPYRAMEFNFTDKNTITQIVIYSTQPYYNEDDNNSTDQAKIVIDFKNLKLGKAVSFSHFIEVKDCIQVIDNEIIPVGNFKEFELIDLRN